MKLNVLYATPEDEKKGKEFLSRHYAGRGQDQWVKRSPEKPDEKAWKRFEENPASVQVDPPA